MSYKPILIVALLVFVFVEASFPQFLDIDERERASSADVKRIRERGVEMLDEIKDILKLRYYDKNYRGIDLDARFKQATEKVKTLNTNSQVFRTIAQVLLEFNDSHTTFYPPGRAHRVEYGFTMQMIGNECVVTDVVKGSDAEAKGLKLGDVITQIGQYAVTRDTHKVISYFIYSLEPQARLRVTATTENGSQREMFIVPKVKTLEERRKEAEAKAKSRKESAKDSAADEAPTKCADINADLIACRLDTFMVGRKDVDKMMSAASGRKKMILDLRGNRGGYVSIEEYLVGHFFDRPVKIGDFITRWSKKERLAKPRKDNAFRGELVVLVDSRSASAAEVFARIIQIEKRGKVVGDVSSGAVMTSNSIGLAQRSGATFAFYGLNVTIGDLIMSDGNRLEHHGVIPDHPVGPTRDALVKKSDPVLSFASSLLGTKLTPEDAGKLHFLTKPPENEEEVKEKEEPDTPPRQPDTPDDDPDN